MVTPQHHLGMDGDRLDKILRPGDVLCTQGDGGGLMRLGATGGFMGHVLLVTAQPRCVLQGSREAILFQNAWPEGVRVLWLVRTMESTRSSQGYSESEYLMHVDDRTGRFLTIAEEINNVIHKLEKPEPIDIWQCPEALRRGFRYDIMLKVLDEIRCFEGNWSWVTAVRAFFLSAQVSEDNDSMLHELQQCWMAEPICSSLIVMFWQRYFCEYADSHNAHPGPNTTEVDALDLIMEWMPLKCDRALPGDVMSTMRECGWSRHSGK